MRNQLAIAVANLEAFIDGKLEPSKPRLRAVLQALAELDELIGHVDRAPQADVPEGPHVSFDICDVIHNEIIGVEAAAAKKQLKLTASYCGAKHGACAAFRGDPARVGQMVKNVLINAVRYTPDGGTIAVDCHRGPGLLELSISDTGPGVEPSEAARIFSLGYRGSSSSKSAGDGIGLWVVKRVAKEHGGNVTVRNNSQSGATFTVQLPGELAGPDSCTGCAAAHAAAHAGQNGAS
jgi:signal transduction histidine kinase